MLSVFTFGPLEAKPVHFVGKSTNQEPTEANDVKSLFFDGVGDITTHVHLGRKMLGKIRQKQVDVFVFI